MPSPPLRVAIAGCGEVSQVIHLPTLANLAHLYKVVALSDVSDRALWHCRSKWGVDKLFSDFYEMLKWGDFDVVFILTADEYHTPYAVAAAEARKAVFIEKPMSLTHADAESIITAQERYKIPIMVGYMRRYAEAFNVFKHMVGEVKRIDYCRVRDIIGENDFFVQQSGTYSIKTNDFPPDANQDRLARADAIAATAIPTRASSARDVATYRLLGSLGSHDLSAMRELLGGVPRSCLAASRNSDPDGRHPFLTALFEYDGFTAVYETGIDKVGVFDASIEVCGDGKRLRLDYDTPYVKGLPITINVRETDSSTGQYVEKTIRPTYTDAYTLELEELHRVITKGAKCKTGPSDAAEDLKIFDMIMGSLRN
ncbi:hypothetical protein JCM3766R1_002342 [Sporobolomyces carnicolor]